MNQHLIKPRKCLITGGAGFIGSHLAELLVDAGHNVTVLDDLSTGRISNLSKLENSDRFKFVEGTISDWQTISELAADADVIFHLAAAVGVQLIVADPVGSIETNVTGTQLVMKAALENNCQVLIASSSEIYGKSTDVPFREDGDRILGPTTSDRWSYSSSKAIDEYLALGYHKKFGLRTTVFRLFNTIGPRQVGQYGMVVPRFVSWAKAGEHLNVYGDGTQTRSFCDVRDIVRAITALAEKESATGQIFNIGSTEEITILDLARKVLTMVQSHQKTDQAADTSRHLDVDDRITLVPFSEAYEPGFEDLQHRVADTTKIREHIGWEPQIKLTETLNDLITGNIDK
jgi:UDP-glucose 4-epimerase